YGWCRGSKLREQDALDVGQEVFRAVYGGIGQFRHDRPGDSFRGWLRVITRNKIRDFLRQQPPDHGRGGSDALEQLYGLPCPHEAEEARAARRAETNGLWQRAVTLIRHEFSELHWQAFWGVAVEGRAAGDVAHQLGTTANVVYLAKSRIRGRLRREFAGLLDDLSPPG